jgi:hypothetical protein
MSFILLYWMAGVTILLVLGIIIFAYIEKTREKEEPTNRIIAENYMPQYTGGHSDLVVDSIEFSEKRTKLVMYPRDLDNIKMLSSARKDKSDAIIKPYILFVENGLIEKVDISAHRQKIKIFPPREEEIPQSIKGTIFGEICKKRIINANMDKEYEELNRKQVENQRRILDDTKGLEFMKRYMKLNNEMGKEIMKQGKVTTIESPEEEK